MRACSSRPFCSGDGRHAGLLYLAAGYRYTTLLTEEPQLMLLPVDKDHPGLRALGIAPARLVEHLGDDGVGRFAHARPHALALRLRATRGANLAHRRHLTHQVVGAPHIRCDAIDGGDRGHALAVALLALGEACTELVCAGLRRLARLWAEGLFAHRHALAIGGEHDDGASGVGLRLLVLRAALRVEGIEILRGPLTQLLGLAFGHLRPGMLRDRRYHLFEAAAGGLHSDL